MRYHSFCIAVAVISLLLTSQADAGLIWQKQPGPGVKVDMKLFNFEEIVDRDGSMGGGKGKDGYAFPDTAGDELRGIFRITSIEDNYWSPGGSGQELTGYFTDYLVKTITPLTGGKTQVDFIGGLAKIFIGSGTTDTFDADYTQGGGGGPIPHGNGYSDGEEWLILEGAGGALLTDLTVTLTSTFSQTTQPVSGSGIGYFNIIGGTGASLFASDALDPNGSGGTVGEQDLKFVSNVEGSGTPNVDTQGWPARSSDPITGEIMPEPASAAIWGLLGICGVVGAVRRRLSARVRSAA